MPEGIIKNMTKSDGNFAPTFADHHVLPDINFNGHRLITNVYIPKEIMNIYISCTLSPWLGNLDSDFTLKSCFFRSAKLTKNNDSDKFKCSGDGIGFDSRSEFSFTDGSMGKMSLFLELI